jgi:hypothetical protein
MVVWGSRYLRSPDAVSPVQFPGTVAGSPVAGSGVVVYDSMGGAVVVAASKGTP